MIFSIKDLVAWGKKRQTADMDLMIGISGEKGVGKSTLAIQIAQEAMGADFRMDKHVIISEDAMVLAKHLEELDRNAFVVLDEAILALYKQNWGKKDQKGFHIWLNAFMRRERNLVVLALVPDFQQLRTSIIKECLTAWIHVYSRGRAIIMLKEPFSVGDPFHIERLTENYFRMARNEGRTQTILRYNPDFLRKVYRSQSTYWGEIKFNKLDYASEREYLEYSNTNRKEVNKGLHKGALESRLRNAKRTNRFIANELRQPGED